MSDAVLLHGEHHQEVSQMMQRRDYYLLLLIQACRDVVAEYEKGNIKTKQPKNAVCLTMLANRVEEVERSFTEHEKKETRKLNQ